MSGQVGYWKKIWLAGRVCVGRSVEICDRVFSGIFFALGYSWVFFGVFGASATNIEVSFFHLLRVFFIGTANLTFRDHPLLDYFHNCTGLGRVSKNIGYWDWVGSGFSMGTAFWPLWSPNSNILYSVNLLDDSTNPTLALNP